MLTSLFRLSCGLPAHWNFAGAPEAEELAVGYGNRSACWSKWGRRPNVAEMPGSIVGISDTKLAFGTLGDLKETSRGRWSAEFRFRDYCKSKHHSRQHWGAPDSPACSDSHRRAMVFR